MIKTFVTIGGNGTRMKSISPKDKHLLYYKDKRIIEWITLLYPNAILLGNKKTRSRRDTLAEISTEHKCLIIDCDIIPYMNHPIEYHKDTIYVFESNKNKYGSVVIDSGIVKQASEINNISKYKCSGAYYIESMADMLDKMQDDNSIAFGMIGAAAILETTFVRIGDVEDYFEAL